MNNLEKLAQVDVSIGTPISDSSSFDNILLIGRAPAHPKGNVPTVGVYSGTEEVEEIGYSLTNDPVGIAARVAFSQTPRPGAVYIAAVPEQEAEETDETDPDTPADEETDPEAPANEEESDYLSHILGAAFAVSGWYCVCPVGLDSDDVLKIIRWTESHDKICGYAEPNPDEPITPSGIYMRSFAVCPRVTDGQSMADIPAENLYGIAAAMAVRAMNYHAGEETWAHKTVSAVIPSRYTSTFVSRLERDNISYVHTVGGKNISYGGKTNGGEWIDVIRFRDWLRNDMQVRVANLLVVNPKIPYTDGGIALVENQMTASLKSGQAYGGIAPTEYYPEGEPNPGFTTSVPRASEITSVQKASRVLENCRFTARLAGAVHLVKIKGNLTNENLE